MTQISTLTQSTMLRQQISDLTRKLTEAQQQLSSGKKYDRFSQAGGMTTSLISLRGQGAQIQAYQRSIQIATTRAELTQQALTSARDAIDEVTREANTAIGGNNEKLGLMKMVSRSALDRLTSALNVQVDGRYLLSGTTTNKSPVTPASEIIDGRKVPALAADFTALAAGDTVTLDLLDKDGVAQTITLTAVSPGPPLAGEFEVGATIDETVANLRSQINAEIAALGGDTGGIFARGEGAELAVLDTSKNTEWSLVGLTSTGTPATGTATTATQPGLRQQLLDAIAATPVSLPGSPAAQKTAILTALDNFFAASPVPADRVPLYNGDTVSDPRAGQRTLIDDGRTIEYGARADEAPVIESFKAAFLLGALNQSDVDPEVYKMLVSETAERGAAAFSGMKDLTGEIGLKQQELQATADRHETILKRVEEQVSSIENADPYEVANRLRDLETQLTASYQITARIKNLSLVNFL